MNAVVLAMQVKKTPKDSTNSTKKSRIIPLSIPILSFIRPLNVKRISFLMKCCSCAGKKVYYIFETFFFNDVGGVFM
jgi:hypothetical protein